MTLQKTTEDERRKERRGKDYVGRTQQRRQNRFQPWPTQREEGPLSSSNLPGIISSSFLSFLSLSLVLPLAALEPHHL